MQPNAKSTLVKRPSDQGQRQLCLEAQPQSLLLRSDTEMIKQEFAVLALSGSLWFHDTDWLFEE